MASLDHYLGEQLSRGRAYFTREDAKWMLVINEPVEIDF